MQVNKLNVNRAAMVSSATRGESCPICKGEGHVSAGKGRKRKRETKVCIKCRGTGKVNGSYLTK